MSQSFHLYQLQKIDTQLDQGTARILEINDKIEHDSRLQAQKKLVEEAEKELSADQAKLKRIEQDTLERRIKLEQCESSLYGGKVKAPRELQDLQSESAALKRAIAALEDQELEAMIKAEESQAKLNSARNTLSSLEAEVTGEHAVLAGERSMLKALNEKLMIERSAVISQITPNYREE